MNDQPNTWISNAVWPAVLVVSTAITMRLRNRMCKQQPSLRTKYAVDLRYMIMTNLLSMSALIIWSVLLDLPLEDIMAVDVVLTLILERWIVRIISSYDSTSYHPGGSIGRTMIFQHMRLLCLLATIARGYSAAVTLAIAGNFEPAPNMEPVTYYMLLPFVYVTTRTIVLDMDLYQPGLGRVQIEQDSPEFTITDEEDEYQQEQDLPDLSACAE